MRPSQNRTFVSAVMASLVVHVTDADLAMVDKVMHNSHGITRWPCYTAAVDAFDAGCFRLAKVSLGGRLPLPHLQQESLIFAFFFTNNGETSF